jgi:hypothetical protein
VKGAGTREEDRVRKGMTELERRLAEAADRLERHYDQRQTELTAFEKDLAQRLTLWAGRLDTLSASLEVLQKRQDQIEQEQKVLAEQLELLGTVFKTSAGKRGSR